MTADGPLDESVLASLRDDLDELVDLAAETGDPDDLAQARARRRDWSPDRLARRLAADLHAEAVETAAAAEAEETMAGPVARVCGVPDPRSLPTAPPARRRAGRQRVLARLDAVLQGIEDPGWDRPAPVSSASTTAPTPLVPVVVLAPAPPRGRRVRIRTLLVAGAALGATVVRARRALR